MSLSHVVSMVTLKYLFEVYWFKTWPAYICKPKTPRSTQSIWYTAGFSHTWIKALHHDEWSWCKTGKFTLFDTFSDWFLSCSLHTWRAHTTANSQRCDHLRSGGAVDMANFAQSESPEDTKGLRDSTAVCHCPTRETGHLHLHQSSIYMRTLGLKVCYYVFIILTYSLSADVLPTRWHSRDGEWQHTACDVTPSLPTQRLKSLTWRWELDKTWAVDGDVHPTEDRGV